MRGSGRRIRTYAVLVTLLLLCLLTVGCAGKGAGDTGAKKVGEVSPQGSGQETGQENGQITGQENGQAGNSSGLGIDGTSGQTYGRREDNTSEETSRENSKKTAAPKLFRVGDILEDGDLRIVYIASGEYREKSEYLQPPAGSKYIFLEFSFENKPAGQERSLSLFSFQCYADGYEAQAYYGGRKDLAASLPPGRRTRGCLYFTVPEDAKEIDVEYRPRAVSSERIRFLYEGEKDSGYVPEADPARTAGAFAVGETAETGLQRITCVSCEEDDSDNEFIRPADGCSYYTLFFEIENLEGAGGEDQETGIYDFHCYADGADCSSSLFRDDYLSAAISPGRRAKGTVTFEVPDTARTVEVEYRPGFGKVRCVVFTVR